ncbi:hypothetical protein INT43_007713 [Umbelopsis isabellina]|uniref:NAD(P)-binding protein n=1 Tax=Mortierella isabellina TaxID=91625 RepID=A0A8H7PMZ1_MORIS|nr:hypothetical protein INT43_007713 [Umbelopsis isabellina]
MSESFNASTTSEEVAAKFINQIKGKVAIVTGTTWGGIGAETARVIASHGAQLVIVAGRKQSALDETIDKIKQETPDANLRSLVLDLGSLKSVKEAAAQVNGYEENIDVLINNAAVMASPYFTTSDGFEGQFGTNHLGPFVFTNLILPKLLASKTGEPRVVNVSSNAHWLAPVFFADPSFSDGKTYQKWHAYGQSKTANMLFTKELSNRFSSKGLTVFSLHPGYIQTNLQRHVEKELEQDMAELMKDYWGNDLTASPEFMDCLTLKTVSQGASTTLVAAFDPSIKPQTGLFLNHAKIDLNAAKPYALDDENANKLWELSERMVGQQFS